MRKTIVFIVTNAYPNYTANGLIANKVAEKLIDRYNCVIISQTTELDYKPVEKINGIVNYRVTTDILTKKNKIKVNSKKRPFISKIYDFVIRLFNFVKAVLSSDSIDYDVVDSYYHALESIEENIDVIVPFCFPMEGVLSSIKFKKLKKDIKVIPILIDNFADGISVNRTRLNKKLKFKNNLEIEKEVFRDSNIVLATTDWERQVKLYHSYYYEKVNMISLPVLEDDDFEKGMNVTKQMATFTFSGSLIRGMRPPSKVLNILSYLINDNPEILIRFITRGHYKKKIERFGKKYPKNFHFLGQMSKKESDQILKASDCLISIGNTNSNQTPSKIFEYITLNKPIIHFYYVENDPVIRVLTKYNKSFCYNLKRGYEDLNLLEEFIRKRNFDEQSGKELSEKYKENLMSYFLKEIEIAVMEEK